jgi:hypothetical protein
MEIPKRLAYLLERDQALDGAVKLSISQFEPWIKNSSLPFFPEYTKHDIEHIEEVLRTCVALIRDEAWEAITPGDASVLILAVLLHDCAMHLSEDGFWSLMSAERSSMRVAGMEDRPWDILWEDFYGEASRFDGRKLTKILGDSQPVRRPSVDPNQMTKRDRLLVGEFLRRHHPRLAQEIALFGVPTKAKSTLLLEGLGDAKDHIAKLSGIVARSHGAEIRAFLPYLQSNFDVRQYKNIHPVFLMTLLRVGDYLQVQADRAPQQVLQVRRLASPVSVGEWKAHAAIKDIRTTHEDPEALFIDALPEDIHTFLRVQSWVRGIQQELDSSWAVIGEVFGRYDGLKPLGIVLRRIRSSLDNLTAFSNRVTYLPRQAAFRAADADLLKLLIEPLYGNNPEVGLRELIQNAVDAIRELEQYQQDVVSARDIPLIEQEADVVISVEDGESDDAWVIVSDRGIGMSAEVVVDYFLAAGASFRRSENWRKAFETKDGKSKILRAGRFGVGALASFLLGPEIEVSTRHVEDSEGIEFKATVETDAIELRRKARPVGTTIKIRISKELVTRFRKRPNEYYPVDYGDNYEGADWDWYCFGKPSVARKILGKTLVQSHQLASSKEQPLPGWRRISPADFEAVDWTYLESSKGTNSSLPKLVCNGIKIQDADERNQSFESKYGLVVPKLNVFDPDGRLPLNLRRTDLLESSYPFEGVLAHDVIRDFIAYALVHGPTAAPADLQIEKYGTRLIYPGTSRVGSRYYYSRRENSEDWYLTRDGFGYLDPFILKAQKFSSVVICRIEGSQVTVPFECPLNTATIFIAGDSTLGSFDLFVREVAELGYKSDPFAKFSTPNWRTGGETILAYNKRLGCRLFVSGFAPDRWSRSVRYMPRFLQDAMHEEKRFLAWQLYTIGNCPPKHFDFASIARKAGAKLQNLSVIAEVYLESTDDPPKSPVAAAWMDILRCAEIPYDITTRREKLKHAYAELSAYVQTHKKMKTKIAQK